MIFSSTGLGSHSKNIPPDSCASIPRSGHSSGRDFCTQTGGDGGVESSTSKPHSIVRNDKLKVKSARRPDLIRAHFVLLDWEYFLKMGTIELGDMVER